MSTLLNSRRREAVDQQDQGQAFPAHQQERFQHQHHQHQIMHHQHQQQQQQLHAHHQGPQSQSHDSYLPSLLDRSPYNQPVGGFASSDFIPAQSVGNGSSAPPLIQYDHDDGDTTIIPRGGTQHGYASLSPTLESRQLGPKMPLQQHDRFSTKHDAVMHDQQQQQHLKYNSAPYNMQQGKDFSYGVDSFGGRDSYLERNHSPVDPLDHTFAPSSAAPGSQQLQSHDGLLNLSHLGRGPLTAHSSLSSLSSASPHSISSRSSDVSQLNRYGSSVSDTTSIGLQSLSRSSFSQSGSPSGMSSLSANELGWIKEEIERQQQRDALSQMHLQQPQQQQQQQQQQQLQLQQQQQQHHHSGPNSAPGSNRGSNTPDSLSPQMALYDQAGLLGNGANNSNNANGVNLLAAGSGTMDETKLKRYKTVFCQRMVRTGGCRYGALCDFAHDRTELRRNLDMHWYFAVKCEKPRCVDPDCRYSHNDHEVMYHPRIYKTAHCRNYVKPGGCNRKLYCSFAHGKHELRLHNNTNLMIGGPGNIFGLVPPQPGVNPPQQGQGQQGGGTTLTIQGGSQVLPRELVASLQASGINISAPGEHQQQQQHMSQQQAQQSPPAPLSHENYGSHRGSTGLLGLGPQSTAGNALLNKKFQQVQAQQQLQQPQQGLQSQGHSISPRPVPSASPQQELQKDGLSKDQFTLGLSDSLQAARDGAGSPVPAHFPSSGPPDLSPHFAALGLAGAPAGSAASASTASSPDDPLPDRESFRESTDHLKIRILDLVDEVAAAHYQRAIEDQAVALANGQALKALSSNLHSAQAQLTGTRAALAMFSGEETALASLSVSALDALTAQLQATLAAVAHAKSKLESSKDPQPTNCLACQTEPVSSMVWPCAHRVLCGVCPVETCPSCQASVSRTLPLQAELPNVATLLAPTPTSAAVGPADRTRPSSSASMRPVDKVPSAVTTTTGNASISPTNAQQQQ